MIAIKPYPSQYYEALTRDQLDAAQEEFTALPRTWLQDGAEHDSKKCVVLLNNKEVVGFFVLDDGEDRAIDNKIVLGVNHANQAAIQLYKSRGLSDSGRTHAGIKGVQYIFSRHLP